MNDVSFATPAVSLERDRGGGLLLAIAEVSACVVKAARFGDGMDEALRVLGQAAGFARVYIFQNEGPYGAEVASSPYQWAAPGTVDFRFVPGIYPVSYRLFADWLVEDLRGGRAVEFDLVQDGVQRSQQLGSLDVYATEVPGRVLAVPIHVAGRWWGCLSFDCLEATQRYSRTDLAALQSLAATFGAVLEREQAEEARLTAEREQAEESRRITRHLQAVAAGARKLVDAEDFEAALLQWLAEMGRAAGAARATYYDVVPHAVSGRPTMRALAEWSDEAVGDNVPVSFAEPLILDPRGVEALLDNMQTGDVMAFHTSQTTGAIRDYLEAQGNATVLTLPIRLDDRTCFYLSLDYLTHRDPTATERTVLQTAADSLVSVLKRREAEAARLMAERERAEDSWRITRHLQAVAAGARKLVDAEDFEAALLEWLGEMGRAAGAARASYNDTVVHADSGLVTLRALAEWVGEGVTDNLTYSFADPYTIDPRGAEALIAHVMTGEIAAFQATEVTGAIRSLLDSQGTATVLMVPVAVDRQTRFALALDFLHPKELTDSVKAVLQTAADSLVAVLKRREAEAARLAAERERAAQLDKTNRLLQSIVAGTRALLDAPDFEPALNAWLAMMCAAQEAASATYYDVVIHEPTGRPTVRALAEWAPPGTQGRRDISFASPFIHDPRGAEEIAATLAAGEVFALHTADLANEALDDQKAQGHATTIDAPIMDGSRWIGAISFDYWERRQLNPQDAIILKTAADALAAVLKRNELQSRLLEEQRGRAQLAEQAAAELSRRRDLLEAVVASSDDFLRAATLAEGAAKVLERIGRAMAVDRIGIGRFEWTPEVPRAGWYHFNLEWTAPGIPRQSEDPDLCRIEMSTYGEFLEPLLRGHPVAIVTEDLLDPIARAEQEMTGALSQFQYPIMVDGSLWGTIGADDCTRSRRFDEAEIATLKLLASAISSLVKRERLTQARLEAERSRLRAVERSAQLLASVARASEALLRAGSYREGIDEVLAALGNSIDHGRVYVIENDRDPATGEPVGYCRHQWASAGLVNTANDARYYPFPLSQIPQEGIGQLQSGRTFVYVTADFAGAQRLSDFKDAGLPHTAIGTPILIDGEWWGTIWFDLHGEGAEISLDDEPALRTAASVIASALKRDAAVTARLDAERELAQEKSRMAREIHDTLAQGFTGVIMQLHATEDALDAADVPDASRHTARALDRARMGLSEARRSVYALRPPMLDDGDLAGALRIVLARVFEGVPTQADLHLKGQPEPLSEAVLVELFRIAQEALNNAIKHAGAGHVDLTLDYTAPEAVTLTVADDGVGFDVDRPRTAPGFGLFSMRERAERLGAAFVIASAAGAGTRVSVTAGRQAGAIVPGTPAALLPALRMESPT